MASTAIQHEEEKKEYFDEGEVLQEKITQLAQMIKEAKNPVIFTGAGISTASGIPDYRSGYNTCLPTGPGCWETAANKKKYEQLCKQGKAQPIKQTFKESIQKARPSLTHMALVELAEQNVITGVVSQNIDGIHRKSGLHPDKLAELHGNTNLEFCTKCGAEYMRDFRVRTALKAHDHKTGRKCDNPKCKGELKDTIINFKENLDQGVFQKAYDMCLNSDLIIAMGSSLRVSPANVLAQLPVLQNDGNLVIINLQKTCLDGIAKLCINGLVDNIVKQLMEALDHKIPQFRVRRRVALKLNNNKLSVRGVDSNNAPFDLFKKVEVDTGASNNEAPNASRRSQAIQNSQSGSAQNRAKSMAHKGAIQSNNRLRIGNTTTGRTMVLRSQPYNADLKNIKNNSQINVKLTFQGHFQEPDLKLTVAAESISEEEKIYAMVFNPVNKKWESVNELDTNNCESKQIKFL